MTVLRMVAPLSVMNISGRIPAHFIEKTEQYYAKNKTRFIQTKQLNAEEKSEIEKYLFVNDEHIK